MHFGKFLKFSYPSLEQNQNFTMDYSSCKKMIDVLVLNFKAMFSAREKARKKDFCLVLGGKQENCRDRAPLKVLSWGTQDLKERCFLKASFVFYQLRQTICKYFLSCGK